MKNFTKKVTFIILICLVLANFSFASDIDTDIKNMAQELKEANVDENAIFDDKMLLEGYIQKYNQLSMDILYEVIKDDTLSTYKTAAAIKVFNTKYLVDLVSKEKNLAEKTLLRCLSRTDSPFVEVEIMYALCRLDRYKYFESMVPALLKKLNHYNSTVNELAYENLNNIVISGNNRTREARIVFNTLRKMLFLSRKRLQNIAQPGPKLSKKLKLLRWAVKVLGTQELNKLPKEVINLL